MNQREGLNEFCILYISSGMKWQVEDGICIFLQSNM